MLNVRKDINKVKMSDIDVLTGHNTLHMNQNFCPTTARYDPKLIHIKKVSLYRYYRHYCLLSLS